MQILITNDDGINAPGLEVAYNIAKSLIQKKKRIYYYHSPNN